MPYFSRWLAVVALAFFLGSCCGIPFAPRRKSIDVQCASATEVGQCLECHNRPEKPITSIARHSPGYDPCLRCHPVEPRR